MRSLLLISPFHSSMHHLRKENQMCSVVCFSAPCFFVSPLHCLKKINKTAMILLPFQVVVEELQELSTYTQVCKTMASFFFSCYYSIRLSSALFMIEFSSWAYVIIRIYVESSIMMNHPFE
eukprot:TRINITY_DN8556_c0_g1_i4.p1 TRINITY_DN8556_c0_g1~~TRINITY_DN8556_c0_g1_i4.p1  ORF type:complete len:121 (+),score=12.69 TRINITY_DN8556_c0_g1_i4:465-827(+)